MVFLGNVITSFYRRTSFWRSSKEAFYYLKNRESDLPGEPNFSELNPR